MLGDMSGQRHETKATLSARYRVFLIAPSGKVTGPVSLLAWGDEEALIFAAKLVCCSAIDLWDGVRFLEHFAPHELPIFCMR